MNKHDVKRNVLVSALGTALLVSTMAVSAKPAKAPKFAAEKCYGISQAGKNDCASMGSNSCAGMSKISGDPKAWLFVPKGYCNRIVGGKKSPK